jgi:rubrerythrin
MASSKPTGTRDVTYNLVSIIYHALQGAETYHTYIRDAQEDGDDELAKFFREAAEQNEQLASRAEKLLAQRLTAGGKASASVKRRH